MKLMDISNYRYERKFFISELTKYEVESIVKLHPAMFSEVYHQRAINNIYFDSINLKSYFDNIDGSTHKIKFRIRWYGELFGHVEKPVLELKIKNELLGKKKSYSLNSFKIDNGFSSLTISNTIEKSDIPEIIKMELKSLKPILLNRYNRKYFQSGVRDYRITVDTDLVYYRIGCQGNSFLSKLTDDINVILELKYDQNMDHNANVITNCFPFRLTKSSKYVTCIKKLYIW